VNLSIYEMKITATAIYLACKALHCQLTINMAAQIVSQVFTCNADQAVTALKIMNFEPSENNMTIYGIKIIKEFIQTVNALNNYEVGFRIHQEVEISLQPITKI